MMREVPGFTRRPNKYAAGPFGGSSNGLRAVHGTQSGYVTHRTYDVPHAVCGDACKKAHSAWEVGRRRGGAARRSVCHDAAVWAAGLATRFYVCTKCGQSCDWRDHG